MVVLIVLLSTFGLSLAISAILQHPVSIQRAGCIALSALFLFTGISHFGSANSMVNMLPKWVPWRYPIIYLTGLMEIMIAIGFLRPATWRLTGIITTIFLICVLPSNIYAALNSINFGGNVHGPRYLLFRIPLQIFLLGWVWFMSVRHTTESSPN